MYKIKQDNKHRMKRLIREYLTTLSSKYIPNNLTKFFDIKFSLDNHLAERVIDRKVNKQAFERLVTGLIKYKLCEVIYLSLAEGSVRVNIHDKTGLLLGVTGRHYEDGVFAIKLHTCFIPNNLNRTETVKNHEHLFRRRIDMKDKIKLEKVTREDITLGNNQYFETDNELIYKACRAAYEAAGIRAYRSHEGFRLGISYGTFRDENQCISYGTICSRLDRKHLTPEQILFANAPDWAVDVVRNGSGFYWSDNESKLESFKGEPMSVYPTHISACTHVISKQKVKKQDSPWKPEIGQECKYSSVDGWVRVLILAKHPNQDIYWHECVSGNYFSDGSTSSADSAEFFQPIRFEKEQTIDAALDVVDGVDVAQLEALFEAGLLKICEER